jgi:primosomal protein N' (replication factor Y) (superfamily II helicase)
MSSAARSRSPATLSGPVAICVDRPILALDRPFTYDLPAELDAGVGSLVQVRFHGKLVRGWVLGATDDVPSRMLPVLKRVSPVRFFDDRGLELRRWIGERYVAPLASVIDRSYPPRVASEETRRTADAVGTSDVPRDGGILASYEASERLLDAVREARRETFVLRPAPGEDASVAVAVVAATLATGRDAIVLVPEVDPEPATVRALLDAFGDQVARFFGGEKRSRYRMWLEIATGRYRVVVGTRSAVFAPVGDLGLVYVAREHHSLHREERSPYFHARDVAVARGRIERAVTVLASVMPSLEAQTLEHVDVASRRRAWPPVEVVKPGPAGRAPRLVRALAGARRAFVYEPMRGYGVARVCRACGEPAACAVCGGLLRSERGEIRCVVCEALGRCANCGASNFGVARGGAEHVEEWVARTARVPVIRGDGRTTTPDDAVTVGGIEAVKDLGASGLDLVAILGADASLRRPGISARANALGVWAEVVSWLGPGGRAIVQTNHPNDHAVQALVTGRPDRFARTEAPRLAESGFAVGAPVFRVVGTAELEGALLELPHTTLLVSALGDETVCLLALALEDVRAFGEGIRRLAERGIVTRVEAEPHL